MLNLASSTNHPVWDRFAAAQEALGDLDACGAIVARITISPAGATIRVINEGTLPALLDRRGQSYRTVPCGSVAANTAMLHGVEIHWVGP